MTWQAEPICDDGWFRGATTSVESYQSVLYSSMRRNSPHAASAMARDRWRLRIMFFTAKSSITIADLVVASFVESLRCKSCLLFRTRRCGSVPFGGDDVPEACGLVPPSSRP